MNPLDGPCCGGELVARPRRPASSLVKSPASAQRVFKPQGCSRNQRRSPTAAQIWRRHPRLLARSGGTSPSARHTVSADDVCWADVIFAMEDK
ncbi:MAG: hypothetical protein H7225_08080, partial [Massilia sp.]|nr:hypothetical protein [Aquabacterium sp.]